MNLLVLGGTVFLGRHLVQSALQIGHSVTLFNRGNTNPELFPELLTLRGDRHEDLKALEGEQWDAVLDTSGYTPDAVSRSAKLLSDSVGHYTFISTISVYQDTTRINLTEEAPTAKLAEGDNKGEVTNDTYGPLKALSEEALLSNFSGDVLIIRPGLIVGPHDPTGRFTYWPRRMARGGEVLAPGHPDRPVQLIDVRDLSQWIIRSIENRLTGTFNATGPGKKLTMSEVLNTCIEVSENDAKLTWIEEDYLLETGVQPFSEMPLWLPESQNGLLQVNIERAMKADLTFRPLIETAKDTLAWDQEKGGPIGRGPALGPARELALLQAWHAKHNPED